MNIHRPCCAILFSASLVLTVSAHAETIFRCGNTYSQTPCAEAEVLSIDDSRDVSRKKEVDAATRRDTRLANQLERERLQLEHATTATRIKSAKPKATSPNSAAPSPSDVPALRITPKRRKSVFHKPKDFVALVPGSDQKSAKAKKVLKKQSAASQ